MARQIHELSRRGLGPFIAINCAAIVETLLDAKPHVLSGTARFTVSVLRAGGYWLPSGVPSLVYVRL